MERIKLARYIILGSVALLSFLVLALSGNLIHFYGSGVDFVPIHLALSMAMAVITLVVIVPSLVIDFLRKGAFTSMVIVEVGWTALLTIFWIAAAGEATTELMFLPASCNIVTGFRHNVDLEFQSQCRQEQAIEAFSWLNFIFLLGWLVTILVLAISKHSKGNTSVWKSSVTSPEFLAHGQGPSSNKTYQTTSTIQQQNMGYPPTSGYNPNVAHV